MRASNSASSPLRASSAVKRVTLSLHVLSVDGGVHFVAEGVAGDKLRIVGGWFPQHHVTFEERHTKAGANVLLDPGQHPTIPVVAVLGPLAMVFFRFGDSLLE